MGLLQLLAALVQRGLQLLLLADICRQRLLHLLEMLLEDTHLVVAVRVGDGFFVVPLGYAFCRDGEIGQRLHLLADDHPTEDIEDQQADEGYTKDVDHQMVVFAKDVALGINRGYLPVERLHGAARHVVAHEGFIERVPPLAILFEGHLTTLIVNLDRGLLASQFLAVGVNNIGAVFG